MKKNLIMALLAVAAIAPSRGLHAQSQIVTTGNNLIDPSNPMAADIVIGSNAGTRHDGNIMFWSSGSASRIWNTGDVFNFSQWMSTNPNVGLNAAVGGTSFFQGSLGIGTTTPTYKFNIAQDISMNGDIDIAQFGISGSSDNAKRLVLGYDINGAGFGYIKAGWYQHQWTNLALQPNGGNVGIGITNPDTKLQVNSNNVGSGSTDWIAGNFGATTGDRVVVGLLYGVATIGSHNNGLNAWSNLAINTDGGNVSIGTTDAKGYKLAVNGSVIASSVTVKLYGNWPDYVFKPTYHLIPLSEVKSYIDLNHHLPDMPSEKEVADKGLNLGEMNTLLTKKVEELILYLIEKDKELEQQKKISQSQDTRLKIIEQQLKISGKTQ